MTSDLKPSGSSEGPLDPEWHLVAPRQKVYPKSVNGFARRVKWAILIALLALYYLLPWLRWHRGDGRPDQALLLDLAGERLFIFNWEFWPQEIYFLTGILILAAVSLFLVTSLIGRVWCGYTCPQTVWTDLFIWVEGLIEGDRNARIKLDAAPWTLDKIARKALKHAVWIFIAFWTGGAWIMYYVDAPTVTVQFWTGRASAEVYFFTALFTATTYLLAGWAREQVCTYMCPWPRFQAAMLDEQTFTVTYQAWRGEPRGKKAHGAPAAGGAPVTAVPGSLGAGDCIDCGQCIHVCPTGIDIRDGQQLECINCGLCVDACNAVMKKLGRPDWLITWDTLAGQNAKKRGEKKTRLRLVRPRTLIYLMALTTGALVLLTALAMRGEIGITVERDRAPLFVRLADGSLRNGYTVKLKNMTPQEVNFELEIQGVPGGGMVIAGGNGAEVRDYADAPSRMVPMANVVISARPDAVSAFRILVHGARTIKGSVPLDFTLRNPATGETAHYQTSFLGPEG